MKIFLSSFDIFQFFFPFSGHFLSLSLPPKLFLFAMFLPQIQFILTICQTACAAIWPCGFPIGWLTFQISYMGTFVLLFSNFYIQVCSFNKLNCQH